MLQHTKLGLHQTILSKMLLSKDCGNVDECGEFNFHDSQLVLSLKRMVSRERFNNTVEMQSTQIDG